MTLNQIVKLATDAGFENANEPGFWISDGFYLTAIEMFAALVAAAEREACAKVAEKLPETFKIAADEFGYTAEQPTAENYAAAIRTRDDT
jgi:hypothetical protein